MVEGKKGKGKGKGKKGKGKNPHVNFHHAAMAKGKGKGKDKGKSKFCGQHALVCWTTGKSGNVASQCPSGRVSALDENLFGEVEDPGDRTWFEEDWTSGDWSEDWWSDELVAAVYASEVGAMHGLTLRGVWFQLLLRRLLHLQPLLLLSERQLQMQL